MANAESAEFNDRRQPPVQIRPSRDASDGLASRVEKAGVQAVELAREMEIGSDATPLQNHLEQLLNTLRSETKSASQVPLQQFGNRIIPVARRIEVALHLLREVVDSELRVIEARTQIIDAKLVQIDNSRPIDRLRDKVASTRREIEHNLQNVERCINDEIKRRVTPGAATFNRLGRVLEEISSNNLEEERRGKIISLRPRSALSKQLTQLLSESVLSDVGMDLDKLATAIFSANLLVANSSAGSDSLPPINSRRLPSAAEAISDLKDRLFWDMTKGGELPVRGFLDRLNTGRRPVFIAMMLTSLFGGALGIRGGLMLQLAPFMLGIFVIGFLWTFRSFRAEREERLHQELARLRESLSIQGHRLYETVQREWSGRVAQLLRDADQQFGRQIDAALRMQAERQAVIQMSERRVAQDCQNTLIRKKRELVQRVQRIDVLAHSVGDAVKAAPLAQ